MKAGQLDSSKLSQAWDIVNDAMMKMPYYVDKYPTRAERLRELAKTALPALEAALKDGFVTGVWDEALLVSLAVTAPYKLMREPGTLPAFDEQFPKVMLDKWDSIAGDPIYILYCLTRDGYKHLAHIPYLLDDIAEKFPNQHIFADTEMSQYLKLFRDRGYICEQGTPGNYYCIRVPTPSEVTFVLPSSDLYVEIEAFRKAFVGTMEEIPGGHGIHSALDATAWIRSLRAGTGDFLTYIAVSKQDRSILGVGTVQKIMARGQLPFEFTISPKRRNEGWGREMLHYLQSVYHVYNPAPYTYSAGDLTDFFIAAGVEPAARDKKGNPKGDKFIL